MSYYSDVYVGDACVPLSQAYNCIIETQKDIYRMLPADRFYACIVSHIGDGNFHVGVGFDLGNKQSMQMLKAFNQAMLERAIAMKGTCTGEHGIGLGKKESLYQQHRSSYPVMLAVKRALDPHNIMNPGKVLDVNRDQGF